MRAIGYIRYDSEVGEGTDESTQVQENAINEFADWNGHTIWQMFTDQKTTKERLGLSSLLSYIELQSEQFLVIVNDPCQLSDTLEGSVEAVVKLNNLGSSVTTTIDGLPDPLKVLLRAMSETGDGSGRRQSIRRAMETKALRGEGLGRSPYGYEFDGKGKFVIIHHEAEILRLVFRLYLERKGLRMIARYLNDLGHRTRKGGYWSIVTIRGMLRNRVYIGTYQRFGMRLPANHTPIISSEHYRSVQDLMSSRTPRRRKGVLEKFILSGLAYCKLCGNRMIGATRRQTWKTKNGERKKGSYRYYHCQTRANQSQCQYNTRRAGSLEAEVKQFIYDAKGQTFVEAGIATAEEQSFERSINKRLYLKYLQQAADGWITIGRLQTLLYGTEESLSPWHSFMKKLISSIEVDLDRSLVNLKAGL
ncbi:MAG: Recombinase/Recombinase zinc beta ribbon domain-containing protein/Resolvase, N terminal domain [Chloroflexi bacterium]|jgi:site-specific DNA recombinase|nr:MAG: Recombinase/Recombinase zinc beta ribbon domain-containing protein/Resolvase, N terminal domain [Chloroflexota bacterium]